MSSFHDPGGDEAGVVNRVRAVIEQMGPLEAYRFLIAENNSLIRGPQLDNGAAIVAARSAIHTELVRHWAEARHRASGYDKPFAVVALGGTGRGEVAPASDLDFALLFDDALEANPFLLSLQQAVMHTDEFKDAYGFSFDPLPFNLDDAPRLNGKQLNSFLDLQPVYDPGNLAERFRDRIRSTYDAFEHFLHVRSFWRGQWEKAAEEVEQVDVFDIKNDALRVFLAGVWTLAGKRFCHSREIYSTIEDPRDLAAYRFLIRVRCFIHLRHPSSKPAGATGSHPEDLFSFDDFTALGEMLGSEADEWVWFQFENDVRARLIAARRRIARFTKSIIERELRRGRQARAGSSIVYGVGGLYHTTSSQCTTPVEKSRAALSLLLASQRYSVPIDPAELEATFRDAGDWLVPVPELTALFYEERGSLSHSYEFLSRLEGAENRLFPGYAKFEASLDARVMTERKWLRGALERQKAATLEQYLVEGRQKLAQAVSPERLTDVMREVDVTVEAALLDADHLAAVKLALKTKRLPLTPEDIRIREDKSRPLHERYSSGMSEIGVAEYYDLYRTQAQFPAEAVEIAKWIILHRRAFRERADTLNDELQVAEFAKLFADEQLLRTLYVFTCVDRAHWESQEQDPVRWFNMRELFIKTRWRFRPRFDPTERLQILGYPEEEAALLKDFGAAFWGGEYRQYATVFSSALRSLAEKRDAGRSKVLLLSGGAASIVGITARDYRGLAASITGALWHHGLNLRQAHLFSSSQYGLALDFFHLLPGRTPVGSDALRSIEEAIRRQLHIADQDEQALPRLRGQTTLQEWRPGQYLLRHETPEDSGGLVYTLAYKVFRHLRGNIFGLTAYATRGVAYVSVYQSLPPDLPLTAAQEIVRQHFGPG